MPRPPLIRQGEGHHAYTRIPQEQHLERTRYLRLIDRIHDQPELNTKTPTRATAPGDERKLRGIPAISRGVSGHIPGTRPDRIR